MPAGELVATATHRPTQPSRRAYYVEPPAQNCAGRHYQRRTLQHMQASEATLAARSLETGRTTSGSAADVFRACLSADFGGLVVATIHCPASTARPRFRFHRAGKQALHEQLTKAVDAGHLTPAEARQAAQKLRLQ